MNQFEVATRFDVFELNIQFICLTNSVDDDVRAIASTSEIVPSVGISFP